MKTMKTIFTNSETPHIWFYENQDYQKSEKVGAENLFFRGDTIYSYGTHFPIARKLNKEGIVLFTTDSYSNTTAQHICKVRNSIPYKKDIIYVPDVLAETKQEHQDNYNDISRRIESEKKRLTNCQKKTIPAIVESVNDLIRQQNRYTKIFKLGYRKKPSIEIDAKKIREYRAKERAKRLRELKALERKKAKLIKLWKNRELYSIPNLFRKGFAYLRLSEDGEKIETSQGAFFSVDHGRKLFEYLKDVKDGNAEFKAKHFGGFDLISFDKKSGVVVIGCHEIKFSEMERLYNEYSVASEP